MNEFMDKCLEIKELEHLRNLWPSIQKDIGRKLKLLIDKQV